MDVVLTTSDGLPSPPIVGELRTANGSAIGGSDYTTTNTTVNSRGHAERHEPDVQRAILTDAVSEPSENFTGT